MGGRDSIPGRGKFLPFVTASRHALGPIQPSNQWEPAALIPGIKRQGREADHSPPSNAKVKNGGAVPPVPNTSSLLREV
jgi:hypothetical protein